MTIPISTIFEMASYQENHTTKPSRIQQMVKETMNDLKYVQDAYNGESINDDVEDPVEDKDDKVRQIGECKVRYTSEMIYPEDYECPRCGFGSTK